MPLFEIRAIAAGVVLVLALAMTIVGRRLEQTLPGSSNIALAMLIVIVIIVPREYRDLGIVGIAFLLGLLGGPVTALIAGGVTYGIGALIPGGTTVVLLVLIAIVAFWVSREERARLMAIRRAKKLVPGESEQTEFAVVGTCPEARLPRPDDPKESVCAWWLTMSEDGDDTKALLSTRSDEPIELATDAGAAFVEIPHLEVDWTHVRSQAFESEEAARIAEGLGLNTEDKNVVINLRWLPEGTSLFIRGIPTWEADRGRSGYRQTSFVPVFRSSKDKPLTLQVGTLAEIKNRVRYSALMYTAWTLPCVAIAVLQFAVGL